MNNIKNNKKALTILFIILFILILSFIYNFYLKEEDNVIVKKIRGTITTNKRFMNKSPNGLSTLAFSPIIIPMIAPIISDRIKAIVCL